MTEPAPGVIENGTAMDAQIPKVRPAAVSGQFYPGDPSELRRQIEDLLDRATDAGTAGNVRGLIAPHAGYPYSGQTAATAYRSIRGARYESVVVMAPSHRESCGGASVFPGEAYHTPLGDVPVDREMADALGGEGIRLSMAGHRVASSQGSFDPTRGEHAVEVQLPFLQVALPDLKVLPIVMDCRSLPPCQQVAEALVRAAGEKAVLLVASSDLYHGYDYDECVSSDARTLSEVEALDPERLAGDLEQGRAQACGGGPILTLMLAARQMGADSVQVVSQTNSNDVTGQRGGYVVGYGAVVFCEQSNGGLSRGGLEEADREVLGRIARDAVEKSAQGQAVVEPKPCLPALQGRGGAFVTLHAGGRLRGCIGDIHGGGPLGKTVQKIAVAATLRDPRFPPVSGSELDDIDIEISVLSPMRRITTPSEIEVGRHGLWIRQGFFQGVLLPQVATEHRWDRGQFLGHACLKAHLPSAAWQDPETEIWIFSADVFPA